jgi:hypothetical protein
MIDLVYNSSIKSRQNPKGTAMMNIQTAKQVFVATGFNKNMGSMDKLEGMGFGVKNWNDSDALIKEAQPLYNPLDEVKQGNGVTVHSHSDAKAGTVITRTEKTLTIQMDKSTLLNANELEFIPGGFSAHCSNQSVQKYNYERDTAGQILKVSRRKNGEYRIQGQSRLVTVGRKEFHDYNF